MGHGRPIVTDDTPPSGQSAGGATARPDITTMDPVTCRGCSHLAWIGRRFGRKATPPRNSWRRDSHICCDQGMELPPSQERLDGLDYPHYCTMHEPSKARRT